MQQSTASAGVNSSGVKVLGDLQVLGRTLLLERSSQLVERRHTRDRLGKSTLREQQPSRQKMRCAHDARCSHARPLPAHACARRARYARNMARQLAHVRLRRTDWERRPRASLLGEVHLARRRRGLAGGRLTHRQRLARAPPRARPRTPKRECADVSTSTSNLQTRPMYVGAAPTQAATCMLVELREHTSAVAHGVMGPRGEQDLPTMLPRSWPSRRPLVGTTALERSGARQPVVHGGQRVARASVGAGWHGRLAT